MTRPARKLQLDLSAPPLDVARALNSLSNHGFELETAGTRFALWSPTTSASGTIIPVEGGSKVEITIDGLGEASLIGDNVLGVLMSLGGILTLSLAFPILRHWLLYVCAAIACVLAYRKEQQDQRDRRRLHRQACAAIEGALAALPRLVGPKVLLALPRPTPRIQVQEYLPGEHNCLATANAPGSDGLELVIKHGYVYPIGKSLGLGGCPVGDPVFDSAFLLQTNNLPYARAWLGAKLRGQLLALRDRVEVRLGKGELQLFRLSGLSFDEHQSVIELARSLADRAHELHGEWATLAAALDGTLRSRDELWTADGDTAIDVVRDTLTLTLDGWQGPGPSLFTRLRCRSTGDAELVVTAADEQPKVEVGQMPAWLAAPLSTCRPDRLTVGPDGVTLLFGGFEVDPTRLGAACDIAVQLASEVNMTPTLGPYR